MYSLLEIFLTSWIDPYLWLQSMSRLGIRKNKGQCRLIFLLYDFLIIGKAVLEKYKGSSILKGSAMVVILFYAIWATFILFEGTWNEKAIHILMFYSIMIISELCIMGAYSFLNPKYLNGVLNNQVSNFTCGCLEKILQGTLCFFFFRSKKPMEVFNQKKKKFLLIFMLLALLSNQYFVKMAYKEKSDVALLFEIVWLLLVWFILSSLFALNDKNKYIFKLRLKADSNSGTSEQLSDIDQLRHDFSDIVYVMKNLWYYKEYDKLGHYMDTVFGDIEKVQLVFEHPNFPVKILISSLMQKATRAEISFPVEIEVNEFGMTDEDICTILHDLVMAGLEHALEVPLKKAFVQLQVFHVDTGYEIRCKSTCRRKERKQSSYGEKTDSILSEMRFVEGIVEKYHGTIEMRKKNSQWKNIELIEVRIHILCD